MTRNLFIAAMISVFLSAVPIAGAQAQGEQPPLTEREVERLIKRNKKDLAPVVALVEERGVDFDVDDKVARKFRRAGVSEDVLAKIWQAGPTAKASLRAMLTTAAGVQLQATPQEAKDFHELQNVSDPDRQLALVAQFEKTYPDSELMSYAYTSAAKAWQMKGDLDKLLEYGEKSLKLDPDNVYSLVLVALTLPQPRMLQGAPVESNKRLAEAETYATRAIQLIDQLPPPTPDSPISGEMKTALLADAHFARGMAHLMRDDFAKAVEDLNQAIFLKPSAQYFFRLGEAHQRHGNNGEAMKAFGMAAQLGEGTVLKAYAEKRLEELKRLQ
jgi:tetratricopeptide (TPR) repeat protein